MVVLGRSQLVGKPMALLLLQKGPGGDATVTVCHTATREPAGLARQADILIVAMGRAEQVTAEWVKPGAVVIDVGIHRRDDGRLCGDVHFSSVVQVASRITPVPGGVGPMTVAMLLRTRSLRLVVPSDSLANCFHCLLSSEARPYLDQTRHLQRALRRLGVRTSVSDRQGPGLRRAGDRSLHSCTADRRTNPDAAPELRTEVESAGLETIGLHWLLARTEGYYLTSPDPAVRRETASYLSSLAEATRDLGGSLMVLGSPKQRDLLPGVTYDQALDYAIEVFHQVLPAPGFNRSRSLPRATGTERHELHQHLCPGDGGDSSREPSPSAVASGRQGTEQRAGSDGPRTDRVIRVARGPLPRAGREPTRSGHGRRGLRTDPARRS